MLSRTASKVLTILLIFKCDRFVLEPKSFLMDEQEQRFKDSESAIASLQVWSNITSWLHYLFWFNSTSPCIKYVCNITTAYSRSSSSELWVYCLIIDLEGILREAVGRGGEQPKGAIATRSWSRPSNYVHVNVTYDSEYFWILSWFMKWCVAYVKGCKLNLNNSLYWSSLWKVSVTIIFLSSLCSIDFYGLMKTFLL